MKNANGFTKIELPEDEYAWGYIHGCLDTTKRFHRFAAFRTAKSKASANPTPLPSPSFVIVLRRGAAAGLIAILALAVTACTAPRPFKGGRALTTGPMVQTLSQPENPAATSRQTQDTIRTRTYTLPAAALAPDSIDLSPIASPPPHSSPPSAPLRSVRSLRLNPLAVEEREESHATTELGAAQKDTAREIGAKLSSLKSIVWVGLALFLFGLASLFWPPLKAIIASTTTSAAMATGGLALMVLPTLVVGNELLILGGVVLAVGAWFLAHRHGHLRGQLVGHDVRSGVVGHDVRNVESGRAPNHKS